MLTSLSNVVSAKAGTHTHSGGYGLRLRGDDCNLGSCLRIVFTSAIPPTLIQLQRFRIGQRLGVLDRAAMHHITDGKLGDLAGFGARDIGDLDDLGRHMARRERRC